MLINAGGRREGGFILKYISQDRDFIPEIRKKFELKFKWYKENISLETEKVPEQSEFGSSGIFLMIKIMMCNQDKRWVFETTEKTQLIFS